MMNLFRLKWVRGFVILLNGGILAAILSNLWTSLAPDPIQSAPSRYYLDRQEVDWVELEESQEYLVFLMWPVGTVTIDDQRIHSQAVRVRVSDPRTSRSVATAIDVSGESLYLADTLRGMRIWAFEADSSGVFELESESSLGPETGSAFLVVVSTADYSFYVYGGLAIGIVSWTLGSLWAWRILRKWAGKPMGSERLHLI